MFCAECTNTFLLTSFKWFLSFGEAERYISHCSVAIIIITIQYIPTTLLIGLIHNDNFYYSRI